jgi:integration host factor subunit beta
MAKTIDLIKIIASKYNLSEKDSKEIINILFDYITIKLSEKDRIEIRNFGIFTLKSKKNNLNWTNKYSLCKQDFYNVINYKMSKNLYLKLKSLNIR